MSEYCKQCGKKDHGTAGCYTNDDKPIYSDAMDVIAELKKKLADMQCCGNCINHKVYDIDSCCDVTGDNVHPAHVCEVWKSDNKTKEQR